MSADELTSQSLFEDNPVLGKYISHHPVNRTRLSIQGAVIYGVSVIFLQLIFADLDEVIASIILIGAYAVLSLGIVWYTLHLWNREVVLYERGFTYREGSYTAQFNYAEVRTVRQSGERRAYFGGLFRRNVYTCTVTTIREEIIKLTNLYKGIDQLGLRLEQSFIRIRQPAIQQQMKSGEKVRFGETLQVSSEGLHTKDQDLEWSEFTGYQIQQGHLILSAHDNPDWLKLPLQSTDNLMLLINLLREWTTERNS